MRFLKAWGTMLLSLLGGLVALAGTLGVSFAGGEIIWRLTGSTTASMAAFFIIFIILFSAFISALVEYF